MKNIQNDFERWLNPQKPKSYYVPLDEIRRAYFASFGKNAFEIDEKNIQSSIKEIQANINRMFKIKNNEFTEFSSKRSNEPQAIINKWLIKYLKEL